ncbi:MAG: DUF2791 family P-loop domain-containing protein [Deltaproteobacteria bacterium]|nr:DUF2791 family P-loop domain-containing protein [Deltaproteobacteria bacterium]
MTASGAIRVLGRFELLEQLGQSEVTAAFRARRRGVQGFEKILLVKIPAPGRAADRRLADRLVTAAGAVSALTHANIVQVIELAEEDGSPALALEFVHGTDLGKLVQTIRTSGRSLPAPLGAFIIGEICKALDFASTGQRRGGRALTGIAHGALHSGNVLVSFEGDVKVADFGFSRAALTGSQADAAEDVAAVGSLLATLLSLSADRAPDLEAAALAAQALDPSARPAAPELFRLVAAAVFSGGQRPTARDLSSFLVEVGLRPPPVDTGRIVIEDVVTARVPRQKDEALEPTAPDMLRDAFGVTPTHRFVGRAAEMKILAEAFDGVRAGSVRAVFIEGGPGTGKTFLLAELGRHAMRAGSIVAPLALRRELARVPFHSIRALLRSLVGIPPDAGPTHAEAVTQLIRDFALTPYESEIARRLALGEDGVGLSPAARVRPVSRVVGRLVARLAGEAAVMILVDDAHHLDPVSRAVLEDLPRRVPDRPLMLVMTRPPTRKETLQGALTVPLASMSDEQLSEILASRSGTLGREWITRIAQAAGGNPRTAIELDSIVAELPGAAADELLESPSHEQLAMDRVGALPTHERRALGIAAHVGDLIDPQLLARLLGVTTAELASTLESLADKGLLSRRPASTYVFASEATRTAASREIAHGDEPALHRFAALTLSAMEDGDPHTWATAMCDHAERGGARASIAAALAKRGRTLAGAGAGAGLDLLMEALRTARETIQEDPAMPRELSIEVGELALRTGQYHEGIAALRLGRVLARRGAGNDKLLQTLRLSARLLTRAERYSEAFKLLEEAHSVADGIGEPGAIAQSHAGIGEALTQMGEFSKARPYLDFALQHMAAGTEAAARLHGQAALVAAAGGDAEAAREHLDRLAEARVALADDGVECEALKMTGLVEYALGDLDAALAAFESGLNRSLELGFRHEAAVASINVGDCYLRRGDVRRAFGAIRYAYEVAREHDFSRARSLALHLLGYLDASVLESPEGRLKVAQEAAEARTPWDVVQTRFALGRIEARAGRTDEAIAHLREALDVGRNTGNRILELEILELLSSLGAGE